MELLPIHTYSYTPYLNPQGQYQSTNSLNVYKIDNVDAKSAMEWTLGTLHYWEALMETLLFNYGVGNAYTQPQVQNQSYQHMNQCDNAKPQEPFKSKINHTLNHTKT